MIAVSIQLAPATLAALLDYAGSHGEPDDLSATIGRAIDAWLAQQAIGDAAPAGPLRVPGYLWKNVFLPEGTIVRMSCTDSPRYARVEGDRLVSEGRAVSPHQFACSFTRSGRNAWRDLRVRLPGEAGFRSPMLMRRQAAAAAAAAIATPTPASPPFASPASPASPAPAAAPPAADPPPYAGWDLREKRALRYRYDDIALD